MIQILFQITLDRDSDLDLKNYLYLQGRNIIFTPAIYLEKMN